MIKEAILPGVLAVVMMGRRWLCPPALRPRFRRRFAFGFSA